MKSIDKILTLFFLLTSLCLAEETIKLSQQQLDKLGVKLGKLEAVDQVPLFNAPASVTVPPSEEYIVTAPQSGLISKLDAAIGDQVDKNQVIALLNSPEFLSLQRRFLKTNSNRRLAFSGFQRDKKLFAEGVISERRWQETKTRYLGLVSEANETRQLLEIAGMSQGDIASLSKTRKFSAQLKIRSPISGVVLERSVVAGERVDMLAPLYRVANLSTLWLEIYVPQEKISKLRVGDKLHIKDTTVSARITMLGKNVNSENQTILARAVITNPNSNIRVGQRVTVQVIQQSKKQTYKISNSGIAQREGSYHIFIHNKDGFIVREINILGRVSSHSMIAGNLTGLEQVAVQGSVALKAVWMGLGADEETQGE